MITVESGKNVLVIALDSFVDDSLCFIGTEELAYCGLLVLELLIYGEEVHDFIENVGRKLVDGLDLVVVGVGDCNGNDLVIKLAAVDHSHNADGVNVDEGHRIDRLHTDNENVKRVTVICISTRNKAVVCGIVGGGVEDTVKTKQTCVLVKLIFALASLGDLDESCKYLGGDESRVNVMPNVHS
jgi:hypothetical protein